MDLLGIGPLELMFILVIALIVLGPKDIVRFARTAGKALNRMYRSEAWGAVNKASREFRDLPNRLAREAALDDLDQSIREAGKKPKSEEKDDGGSGVDAWKPSPKQPEASSEEAPADSGTEEAASQPSAAPEQAAEQDQEQDQ